MVLALQGNSSIKNFAIRHDDGTPTGEELLGGIAIHDEGWSIMCQSLANHPALEYIALSATASRYGKSWCHASGMQMSKARETHRSTPSLVDMLKVNAVVKHMDMRDDERNKSIW
jgi:hypothetical protein